MKLKLITIIKDNIADYKQNQLINVIKPKFYVIDYRMFKILGILDNFQFNNTKQ